MRESTCGNKHRFAPDPSWRRDHPGCLGQRRVVHTQTCALANSRPPHTAKRLESSRVAGSTMCAIRFREDWSSLHVSILAPASPHRWRCLDQPPTKVQVTTKGRHGGIAGLLAGDRGEQTAGLLCSSRVEYTAKIDPALGNISRGLGIPGEACAVELRVSRLRPAAAWQAGPPVDAEIELNHSFALWPDRPRQRFRSPCRRSARTTRTSFTATALAATAWTADRHAHDIAQGRKGSTTCTRTMAP